MRQPRKFREVFKKLGWNQKIFGRPIKILADFETFHHKPKTSYPDSGIHNRNKKNLIGLLNSSRGHKYISPETKNSCLTKKMCQPPKNPISFQKIFLKSKKYLVDPFKSWQTWKNFAGNRKIHTPVYFAGNVKIINRPKTRLSQSPSQVVGTETHLARNWKNLSRHRKKMRQEFSDQL